MQPEISVIVPIYNMESRLSVCVNSIIQQTFQNFEVILIDDGSTDHSAELCDRFCEKDARISVIHKENAGLPKARETGVSASKGKYICFIDSDDYVEQDYLEKLYSTITSENCDIVCCGFYTDYPSCPSKNIAVNVTEQKCSQNAAQYIETLHIGHGRYHAMWNKLFRKECFCHVVFPPQHTMYEDYFIMIQILPALNKITLIPDRLYHYVQTEENMTGAGFGKTYEYGIYHMQKSQKNILDNYPESASYIITFRLRLEMFGVSVMTRNDNYDYSVAAYVKNDVRKHFFILWTNPKCSYIDKIGALCIVLNLRLFWFGYKIYRKWGGIMNNQGV